MLTTPETLLGGEKPIRRLPGLLRNNGKIDPEERAERVDGDLVYTVSTPEQVFGRATGESTVLYVGKGTWNRVAELWGGTHSSRWTLARLKWARSPDKPLHVEVAVFSRSRNELHECLALVRHMHAHGELPPANLRWEKWLADRVIEALMGRAIAGRKGWKSLPRAYHWPKARQAATLIDLHFVGGDEGYTDSNWRCSLGWVWHAGWQEQPDEIGGRAGGLVLVGRRTDKPGVGEVPEFLGSQEWEDCHLLSKPVEASELSGVAALGDTRMLLDRLFAADMGGGSPVKRLWSVLESLSQRGPT